MRSAQSAFLPSDHAEPSELDGPIMAALERKLPGAWFAIILAGIVGACGSTFAAGVFFALDFACR